MTGIPVGISPSGIAIELQVDDDGRLKVVLPISDLELGAVEIKDATSTARASISTKGGQTRVNISDLDAQELLNDILAELKKMNLYFSLITDEKIEEA